jgi:CheY-like chemotaxis protein
MEPKPIHIIFADDDPDDHILFKEVLNEIPLNYTHTGLYNGEQLMQFLSKGLRKEPTILFLDLNMPKKNGYECLVEIKESEKLKSLHTIVFSTSYDPGIVNQLYQKGADQYIRKPEEFAILKETIHKILLLFLKSNSTQSAAEKADNMKS